MNIQLKNFFVSTLIIIFSVTTLSQESDDETSTDTPAESEEIVVIGRKNFCIPEVMQQALGRDYQAVYGGVHEPGWVHPDEGASSNPNNYWAGARNTAVTSIDYKNKSLKLVSGYFNCKTTECESLFKKTPEITFIKEKDINSRGPNEHTYYSFSEEIKFDEIYNAHNKDVKVACPEKTCDGVVMEAIPEGRLFYTAIRNGNVTTKRLVVHGGLNSKMVTTGSDVGEFDKCETPEEPELPAKKKKSKH